MKNLLIILLFWIGSMNLSFSQEYNYPISSTQVADSRNKIINTFLDYRFLGGHWAFEKLFYQNFKYPDYAKQSCVGGIIILKLDVNCNGEVENVIIRNPLGYGIEQEIKRVLSLPNAKWNSCNDDKYTNFEIPISIFLEGTETNVIDPYLIVECENPGYNCRGDQYYWERAKKYLEKKKGKKAIKYLDVLIKRNPMTHQFLDFKKEAIKMME